MYDNRSQARDSPEKLYSESSFSRATETAVVILHVTVRNYLSEM